MRSLSKIILRELRLLGSDPLAWFCMVVAPLLTALFFTTFMWQGLPTDMPVGLVDGDNTSTSRQIARNLDAMQQTRIAATYADVSEARRAMQRGDIYAFFYIPHGTTRLANQQKQPTISYYTNYSYLVAGSLVMRDMRMMSELASGAAARKVLYAKGATEQQAMAFLQPIVIETHPVSNPTLNYNVYLSNTLIPGILGIFIFMMTVYSIGMEIKNGTAGEWLGHARGSILTALAGKLLPQTVPFLLAVALMDVWLYGVMQFPCQCGAWAMFGIGALYVLACQGMGVFMIAMLPTLRLGLSFASLWGVLSFSICGMSYPVMAMDAPLQGIALLFPLRHYFLLYVNCALDGYPLPNAWPYAAFLLFFVFLPLFCGWWLKRQLLTVKYIP
ncbi:MAG: ABC transporter permease [Alloprevotella sp.]|nr:ABC transporter permease [Alloprevotella sp.]